MNYCLLLSQLDSGGLVGHQTSGSSTQHFQCFLRRAFSVGSLWLFLEHQQDYSFCAGWSKTRMYASVPWYLLKNQQDLNYSFCAGYWLTLAQFSLTEKEVELLSGFQEDRWCCSWLEPHICLRMAWD